MKHRWWILVVVVACLVLILVRPWDRVRNAGGGPKMAGYRSASTAGMSARCLRVIDGDTLVIDGARRVRLIGIDTPERGQPGYREATEFTKELVLRRSIRLEVCPVKPTDRYGRLRAVVFYDDSTARERNLAIELLREGYANVYTLPPCHLDTEEWLPYAREARDQNRGLWSEIGEVPTAHEGTTVLEPR